MAKANGVEAGGTATIGRVAANALIQIIAGIAIGMLLLSYYSRQELTTSPAPENATTEQTAN
jgi:hypothetical protein